MQVLRDVQAMAPERIEALRKVVMYSKYRQYKQHEARRPASPARTPSTRARLRCSAAQRSAAQRSTAQHSTAQHSARKAARPMASTRRTPSPSPLGHNVPCSAEAASHMMQ